MPPPLMYFTCISLDDFNLIMKKEINEIKEINSFSSISCKKKNHINMHTDMAGHRMFGWEYVLVFAFEFTLIVTIVYQNFTKT